MVPNGWDKQKLTTLCDKIAVGLAISVTPYMAKTGVKLIRNQNIKRNYFKTKSVVYITDEFASKNNSKRVYEGDVVAVRTGSNIGEACVVPAEFDGALTFTTLIARPSIDKLNSDYLSTHINSEYGISEVQRLMAGGGKPNLNSGELKNYTLLTPPLPEQRKIAKILSTWDKAISTIEKLIVSSKQQKKSLMQQLLTGKKRFGFEKCTYSFEKTRYGEIPADWIYPTIKEVCTQVSVNNSDGNDYPVLSCSKHYGFVDSLKYFKKKVYSDNTSGYRIIPRHCFGFPSNHIEEGSIGLQTTHDKGIVSPIYVVFKANHELVNNNYLYALLKTEHYRQIFCAATNASVDRRGSLRWKEFSAIHIPLPPIEEQQKIASVLISADKEIELLETKLAHFKQEKKALMQQLLTGKKRVKIDKLEVA